MTLHKPFLEIVKNAKAGTVSDFLAEMDLVPRGGGSIILDARRISDFESIAYTIDFLEKRKLVTVSMDPGDVPHVRFESMPGTHAASRLEYVKSLLERHYRKHIVASPEFMLFAERGYRMPEAIEIDKKIILLFVRTILLAIVTAFLNRLLS